MEGIAAIKSFFVALPIDYFIVLNISFENIPLYLSKQMFLRFLLPFGCYVFVTKVCTNEVDSTNPLISANRMRSPNPGTSTNGVHSPDPITSTNVVHSPNPGTSANGVRSTDPGTSANGVHLPDPLTTTNGVRSPDTGTSTNGMRAPAAGTFTDLGKKRNTRKANKNAETFVLLLQLCSFVCSNNA